MHPGIGTKIPCPITDTLKITNGVDQDNTLITEGVGGNAMILMMEVMKVMMMKVIKVTVVRLVYYL